MDTIFALASAEGKAGVAVIRVSGPLAFDTALQLTGQAVSGRGMTLCTVSGADGAPLDHALTLSFQGPASFTGEDVIEFHLHGSPAIIAAVLERLSSLADTRLADPGEFTRRALENGKLDLAQVEGLADLIDAETEAQRRQAQQVFSGALGELVSRWRNDLIRVAALIEATIDFVEEDVPVDVTPEVSDLLSTVLTELQTQTNAVPMAERIRTGFEIAIVGPPNVGKSTLLNALAGRRAAITSEFAGTTRDIIEVRMDLQGLPVTLLDMAGIRETADAVEEIGIELALERAGRSDLRVFLAEAQDEPGLLIQPGDIVLRPKADQRQDRDRAVSGLTGDGIDDLVRQIGDVLKSRAAQASLATRARHEAAMRAAVRALILAKSVLEDGQDRYDIAAEEVRVAIRSLETIVGRIDAETLLDEIFSSFCLGK